MVSALAFLFAALCLLAAAVLVWRKSRPPLAVGALHPGASAETLHLPDWPWKDRMRAWLRKCGVTDPRGFAIRLAIGTLLCAVVAALLAPWWAVPLVLCTVLVLAWLALVWRGQRRRAQIVVELPNFLDGMVRITRVGASLPAALLSMSKDARGPIRDVFLQVGLRQQAGLSLDQAMTQVAKFYDISELHLLAAILRLNQRYGGRVDTVLERIAEWMRSRVAAQAELAALSSETKMSGLLLSLLVPGLGAFIFITNYRYMALMLKDPTGRTLLAVALALMVSGIVLLARLARIKE